VEIDNSTSELFDIILGCVQGIVQGPIIFGIFMSSLADNIDDVTSYADDTYGIIESEDDLGIISTKILDHLKWFNESKTDMIMHKTNKLVKTFDIEGNIIKSQTKITILFA